MWLKLLALVISFFAIVYTLSPLVLLLNHLRGGGRIVLFSYTVLGVKPSGKTQIEITFTYTGPIPIHEYSLSIKPYCLTCVPVTREGKILNPGDSIRAVLELDSTTSRIEFTFSGSLAGIYRFKISYNFTGGVGF
ncbi:MAG: hypothetical protein ACP5IE_04720 [Infirmifilum sp.]|jgi:hypothetical protein|uniref:DUF1573 domain-containing protein n=2 Tax=Thermofilaceae TaxID=114378 RepID=A0A0F7FGW1_9CREN|nr:hypothetical protein MA03_02245 [Infirmifilum uzonense]